MYLRRPQQQKQAVSKRELERRLSDLEEKSKSPYSKEHVVDSAIGGAALGGPIGFGLGVKSLGSPGRYLRPSTLARATGAGALGTLAGATLGAAAGATGIMQEEQTPGIPKQLKESPVVAPIVGGATLGVGARGFMEHHEPRVVQHIKDQMRRAGHEYYPYTPRVLDHLDTIQEQGPRAFVRYIREHRRPFKNPGSRALARYGVGGAALGGLAGLTGAGLHRIYDQRKQRRESE